MGNLSLKRIIVYIDNKFIISFSFPFIIGGEEAVLGLEGVLNGSPDYVLEKKSEAAERWLGIMYKRFSQYCCKPGIANEFNAVREHVASKYKTSRAHLRLLRMKKHDSRIYDNYGSRHVTDANKDVLEYLISFHERLGKISPTYREASESIRNALTNHVGPELATV